MSKNELENLLKTLEDDSASGDPHNARCRTDLLVLLAIEQRKIDQKLNSFSFLFAVLILYNVALSLGHVFLK
jgi:hypothetical protein